jgi:tetratricopeptide (TPR) repeat protein
VAKFLDFLSEPRTCFFQEKNPQAALQLIRPYLLKRGLSEVERRATGELAGLLYRHLRQYDEAVKVYREIGDDYQAGYCLLLAGKLQDLKPYWGRVIQKRPNHWCASLYGMVTHQVSVYPTLLQIRNFLETDVANLIWANQTGLLENLLLYASFMAQMNMETYKFLGRALLYAGWSEKASFYLYEGQRLLPNDPEIYYHLGQFNLHQGKPQDARLMLNQCLLISPSYTPARELLTHIPPAAPPSP